ncbi:hypothetical protein FKM82_015817 [Ascaphus truei]
MFDKRRPSDECSTPPPQDQKHQEEAFVKLESNSSGNAQSPERPGASVPPGHYRQGYCNCCQVHYINLEKHLASAQHKQISTCNRNRFSSSILMDRFLQDVHLYHPQKYHDSRPTYDDIPDVILLPTPLQDGSHVLLPPSTQEKETIGANRAIPRMHNQYVSELCNASPCRSKNNSKKIQLVHPHTEKLEKGQCSRNVKLQQDCITSDSILTTSQKALFTAVNTIHHSSPLRTSPLHSPSPLTANNIRCPTTPSPVLGETYGMLYKCPGSEVATSPTRGLQNRLLNSQGSSCNLTSGKSCGNQGDLKSQGKTDHILRNHVSSRLKQPRLLWKSEYNTPSEGKEMRLCGGDKTSVDEVIEEVIWKHCHGISPRKSPRQDKQSVSSLNIQSIVGYTEDSSISFDLDVPMQSGDDQSKTLLKNVDLLKEINVSLDEDYKLKLTSILNACPTQDIEDVKAESEEVTLPDLPYIPPSFVGKTWSQVMHEDDLKIEAIVNEFKKGQFHCYFDCGSLTNAGRKSKRRLKSDEMKVKGEAKTDGWKKSVSANPLPTFNDALSAGHDSDIPSINSEIVVKPEVIKPGRRTWRLASRCQIVKVSHGTQTSLVNCPVVKRKVIKNELEPLSKQKFLDRFEERTPDMKTRMCALKLPESYTKLLTPVQPNTMVYVLSHPDIKPSKGKPACILKQGRNHYSTDSRDSVSYKYKQSPLKYYDPLTNRILKTPPRNSVQEMSNKGPCVRKLFRSLSSDVNRNKLDREQKESTACKKLFSSCSFPSFYVDSTKGKDVNPSLKGSGSSISTECLDCLKSGYSDKPYAHISISPCKASQSQIKEEIQLTPLNRRTRKLPMGPKRSQLPQRENVKASKLTKPVTEPKNATGSKCNQHGIVRTVRGNTGSRIRKQPARKSSFSTLKSTVPFQAHRPKQKAARKGQRNEMPIGKHFQTHLKLPFASVTPTKKKTNTAKPDLKNTDQRKSKDRKWEDARDRDIITRSRTSKRSTPETLTRTLRTREAKSPASCNRTHGNRTTKRRVR